METSIPYELNAIYQALADPTRRAILQELSDRERSIGDIAKLHPMSLAGISKHLKVLERAQLVIRRRQGNCFYLRVNTEALLTAEQWLSHYRSFWSHRLDALQQLFERGKT